MVWEDQRMKRITKEQILREIWENRAEQIISVMRDKGWESCPYTYENFKTDIMKHELLVDERTIRTKWELLVNTEVIEITGRNRGDLKFRAFLPFMPSQAKTVLRRIETNEPVRFSERLTV